MQTKQSMEHQFIDKWVFEELVKGKTVEEMNGTTFVIGNELLTFIKNTEGSFDVEPLNTKKIVIIPEHERLKEANVCHTCGMEHTTHKESLQCCERIE